MEQLMLFDLEPKIKRAIENFKIYEETALRLNPKGYYLSFSGGKDSQVIYHLAQMAKVKFEPHYHITTVDPPELVQFVKKTYPDVIRDKPEISMWNLIVKKQFPPTRKIRYCCSVFKENGGNGQFVVTGVRWGESENRKSWNLAQIKKGKETILLNNDNHEKRRILENCVTKGNFILNPILDWTVEEIWSFLHHYVQTYCELYDCGFSRLGCIGCPMASVKQRKWELNRYPKYKQAYLRSFERMLKGRTSSKTHNYNDWKTPDEVYYWWLYGNEKEELEVTGQYKMELKTGEKPKEEHVETPAIIQGKAHEEWVQEFQNLNYKWMKIKEYGDIGQMWADSVPLNEIRMSMIKLKEIILKFGKSFDGVIPPEVPEGFVANSDRIRITSKQAVENYLLSADYQYLKDMESTLIHNQAQVLETLGRIQRLVEAIEQDDLVVLREYGIPGLYDRRLEETAQKVRKLISVNTNSMQEAPKHDEPIQNNIQISIFDLAS